MPQMSPFNWVIMFLLFLTILLATMTKIFPSTLPSSDSTLSSPTHASFTVSSQSWAW
uniref:ATP synthase F0 subunit 8 n=1 Tax=Pseudachorutes palmiensis TaxID=187685 RepID=A0A650BKC9_9HEXA|nr:ATP synthase F0 subunit 8 [Pseudachorutes palmiensis]